MGRAPCCDKANVKKGPWSPEEDAKLKSYIQQHGTGGNWIALPQKIGLKRCGKSCRLRWLNYLRPNIKHGGFSEEEDNIICSLYVTIGSRWSVIAAQLPGRTDNDIKNYWNTRLKKKLLGKQQHHHQARPAPSPPFQAAAAAAAAGGGPSFNDQDSIRKLLVKLGGRFSHDDRSYQPAPITHAHQHHHHHHQFPNGSSNVLHELVQGQGCSMSSAAVEDYPQRFMDGMMELLYGEEDMNMILGIQSSSNNWGETSTTMNIYPLVAASINNYALEDTPLPQQCVLQDLPYPGPQ